MIADCFARGEINLNVSLSLSLSLSLQITLVEGGKERIRTYLGQNLCVRQFHLRTYPYGRKFDFVLLYSLNPILSLFIFVHLEVQYEVKQQSEPFKLTKASML